MANADLIHQETNLSGTLVTSLASGDGDGSTFTVRFFDAKTKAAREPQSETQDFIVNFDNSKAERIKGTHATASGVTTITIATNGRTIPMYGVGAGTTSGNSHRPGDSIGCVTQHEGVEALNSIMDGTNATGATSFTVGEDGVSNDVYYYFADNQVSDPYIRYSQTHDRLIAYHGTVGALSGQSYSLSGMVQATAAEIAAIPNPKNGDLAYDTDAGIGKIYDGGVWADLQTGGASVPNASTTVAGISQEGTQSDQAAKTATGSTGAQLFVNPANLEDASNHNNDVFLEDMEYANDAAIQLAYASTGDADDDGVIERLDLITYNGTAYRSAMFAWTNAGGDARWSNSALGAGDISALTGAASGAPTAGRVYLWAKTDDHTAVTYFVMQLGSASGDQVQSVAGMTFSASDTWELKSFPLTGATLSGTPDWTNTDYIHFIVVETGNAYMLVDSVWVGSEGTDEGLVTMINSEDFIEAKMIERPDFDNSGVFEAAVDSEIERGVFQNAGLNNLIVPTYSKYARGEMNNHVRIQGDTPLTKGTHDVLYISDGSNGQDAGSYYAADNNDTTDMAMKFSGLFTGADGTVRSQDAAYPIGRGVVNGFTGLSVGALYYLGNSAGNLTATPPTPGAGARICIGRAISATEIDTFDTEHFQTMKGTAHRASGDGTGTTVITTYFKPTLIKIKAHREYSGLDELQMIHSNGWSDGSTDECLYQKRWVSGSGYYAQGRNTSYCIGIYNAAALSTATVSAISNTSFTLNWDVHSVDIDYFYEVEGYTV